MSKLFIGTSGWNYPHWTQDLFYPKGLNQSRWLEYYAKFKNKDIFSFFNNDAYGYTINNALRFRELLKK